MTAGAVRNITAKTGRGAGEALEAILRMSPQHRLVTLPARAVDERRGIGLPESGLGSGHRRGAAEF